MDNLLSQIPVSDSLIFSCGNLILGQQKKKWKWQKHTHFNDEKQKKMQINL